MKRNDQPKDLGTNDIQIKGQLQVNDALVLGNEDDTTYTILKADGEGALIVSTDGGSEFTFDPSTTTADIDQINDDISNIQGDVSNIQSDITDIQNDLGTAQTDIIALQQADAVLENNIDSLAATAADLSVPSSAKVKLTGALSVANTTTTTVGFDTEEFDNSSLHDNVTNNSRITFNKAGLWRLDCLAQFAWNATGVYRYADIVLFNSSGVSQGIVSAVQAAPNPTNETNISCSALVNVAASGWYAVVRVKQDSGGNLNLNTVSSFSGIFVGTTA